MDDRLLAAVERVAVALERLAPPLPEPPDFSGARMFRHDPAKQAFIPAPDYGLALDLLVGVDQQKALAVENLRRFARARRSITSCFWGVRGTGKSSLVKAAFMATVAREPALKLIEVDRDEVAALPASSIP